MNLFFGKISKKYDTKQIDEGYYEAPKTSSWFGDIQIGDYCYIIGGDKIQFWRAREWKEVVNNDRLYFDILNPDLGINVNDFIALTFLKLDKPLLVLSSRSARNRAFFPLQQLENYTPEELTQTSFYKSEGLYRSINMVDENTIDWNSKDIQLYVNKGVLKLIKSPFYDESVYTLFRDNLQYINKGAKHKDGTLNKIRTGISNNSSINKAEIGLRAFYDAFFCDYNDKKKYYLVGAYWDNEKPADMTALFIKEKRWTNGYDDKYIKEVKAIQAGAYIAIKAAYVKGKTNSVMMIKARGKVTRNHEDGQNLAVNWEGDFKPFEVAFGGYMKTVKEVINKEHIAAIWDEEIDLNEKLTMGNQQLELLKYKKQIILQGPPGTGKTKLAKELAIELAGENVRQQNLDWSAIFLGLKVGQRLSTVAGNSYYTVKEVNNGDIVLDVPDSMDKKISHEKIKFFYKDSNWKRSVGNDDDRGAAAIAKFLADNHHESTAIVEEQIKLIQFHPSFSYEDFVRGIVAKPNPDGDGVLYEAEDKVLADFAKLANDNYQISRSGKEKSTKIIQAKTTLQRFVDYVQDELDRNPERKYPISDAVYLFDIDNKRFKYKGDNWKAHEKGLNMKFSELEKIIEAGITQRSDIKDQSNLESLTKQHATYFFNTIEKYRDFEKTDSAKLSPLEISKSIKQKNYILIIDEINRANLSSVLGELIYALEYRGEAVKSMYSVDGVNELILPPNLYIIGTMNTADRSVGHIDYAIRRRFAFVDVLPKDLTSELGDAFHKLLFEQVADIFKVHLSPEFDIKDVQLGHSYFIDKASDGGTMPIRLQYEIKPILIEYVKDGILIGDDILQLITELSA